MWPTLRVHNLCSLVGWAPHCISLVIKLCNLVCNNCFFTTPYGIILYYPSSMPLNIQISFGYSRFLDLCIIQLFQDNSKSPVFHTFLCFKDLTQFDYVPFTSNVAPLYKGCIVPSFVHRASILCSLPCSRAHNYSLLLKLLSCRNQIWISSI